MPYTIRKDPLVGLQSMPTTAMLDKIVVEDAKGKHKTIEDALDALYIELVDEANRLLGQASRIRSMKYRDEELPF